jgi:type IV pilus assembly protein PilA
MQKTNQKGFTLLEILLVITLIAILAGIVIVAINPAYQLANGRNTQRRSDVDTILNAVYQYTIDTNGTLPASINALASCATACDVASPVAANQICKTGGTCTSITDLSTYLVGSTAKYLVSIPYDPTGSTTNGTGYYICKDSTTSRITVCAPSALASTENTATIVVTE